MKSKLRSRWYRSNEKPLESNKNSQKVNEPFGEISNTDTNLKDDLSKFSGSTSNTSKGTNNNESKRKDKSFKKNSRPRRKRHSEIHKNLILKLIKINLIREK